MSETNKLPVDYYERTFSTEPPKPVGLFLSQVDAVPTGSTCPHRNNQFGHNPECRCGWAVADA